jgi:hypothetical protein
MTQRTAPARRLSLVSASGQVLAAGQYGCPIMCRACRWERRSLRFACRCT